MYAWLKESHSAEAGMMMVEFFREHCGHLIVKVNFVGIGKGAVQKLQFFSLFTMHYFSELGSLEDASSPSIFSLFIAKLK